VGVGKAFRLAKIYAGLGIWSGLEFYSPLINGLRGLFFFLDW